MFCRATILCTILICLTASELRADDKPADLKITRVAVFNSGVAYYEGQATIDGSAVAELSFRTEQINDVIKSLVVQDPGGTVGVVNYPTRDPIEKRLKSFGVDLTGKPTLPELLDQLRGQPVEISGDRSLTGVIVGVETTKVKHDDEVIETHWLNVLTDGGVQQVALDGGVGVRLTNDKTAAELRNALATLAQSQDVDKKRVRIRFEGGGQRTVRVAYLLEAPIWKTTYRLELREEKPPFLQGWATVENETEEDWRDVRLSLVSGRPISFVMDLYTPIYIPRPKVELELYASLRPPEYEGAMDKAEERAAGRLRGAFRAKAGEALEELGYMGRAGGRGLRPPAPAGMASVGLEESGVQSVAAAAEAGELFEYTIETPVSIPRQHSAMLPIVNQPVEGEKVSIYNPQTHAKHPLNGLELTNATDLHLMQGPVTVFDGGVYAGDARLPDLKPGEERLIGYALDLAMEVDVRQEPHPLEELSLRIVKGTLIRKRKQIDEREYVIRNKADRPRVVLLEQAYGDEWKLIQPEEPYERTASLSRFRTEVPAKDTTKYAVRLERTLDQQIVLTTVPVDDIRIYLRSPVISDAVRQALQRTIDLRNELDQVQRERQQSEQQLSETIQDQARIRENLRTLQQNTDPYRRQLDKFDRLETQIENLRKKVDDLRRQEQQKRQALEDYLLSLSVE